MSRVLSSAPPLIICPVFLTLCGAVPSACFNGGLHVFPEQFCHLPLVLSVLSCNCATDCLFFSLLFLASFNCYMIFRCACCSSSAGDAVTVCSGATGCHLTQVVGPRWQSLQKKKFKCKQKPDKDKSRSEWQFARSKHCVRFRVQRVSLTYFGDLKRM